MKIAEMFAKPIDRDIQGVIKVGQDNHVRTELEEYVVTNELQDQFAKFFAAYQKSLQGPTDDMGVWISGFFGSGKSHFLKILSYILSNRKIDDKSAVEFFKDKINDPLVYARMQAAADSNTDVILFNIDSKAMSGEKHDNNVIINVFLQVFNEMQGYSNKNAWIADLERQLDAAGRLEDFKQKFQELETNHLEWQVGRDHYSMNKGTISQALVEIGFMSEGDAQGFIDNLFNPYPINIESFAKLVNDFIQKTGRRVAFMVDEVGQFVGDSVQRMLNLQTVVEELGLATQGKAWVIVTSQQAIGDVTTNLNGQDFSKIQGRFKTRIALSSANVDEVIKRRLLAKTDLATNELGGLYDSNAAAINNAIDFDDGVTRQKFSSAKEFAENYPFVPYQFDLLQDVLTAVRTHGSDGKHLSEGERSMLSIFQESAMRKMNDEEGELVPFSLFFEGLAQFLDHTHNIVIRRALDNESLNPNHEKNPFVLQVLKTLFMVKYLESFKADLNNVVTLMISDINVDRIALTKQTQDALNALVREGIVEKHLDVYVFLTDAEQDIVDGIERESISDSAVAESLQSYFYASKAITDRFTYPKLHNRYIFGFNRLLDGQPYGKSNYGLTIQLITPRSEYFGDTSYYAQQSTAPEALVIALPEEDSYTGLIVRSEKIRAYLLSNTNNSDPRFRLLMSERSSERGELDKTAKDRALNALEQAVIYVNGAPIDSTRDFNARLEEAEKALIDNNYRSLDYIDAAKSEHDITQMLADNGFVKTDENSRAVDAVFDWLQLQLRGSQHVTLKEVLTRFAGVPYGYIPEDTQWLVAALLKDGRIKLTYNGETISLMQNTPVQITEYLTKKQYAEKIAIQVKVAIASRDLTKLREVAGEVFNKQTFSESDAETVATELQTKVKSDLKNLEFFETKNSSYPGHDLIQQGIGYLHELVAAKDSDAFVAAVMKRYDDLLDWHEECDETETMEFYFSAPSQKIWDDALTDLRIYNKSKDYLAEPELAQLVAKMDKIIQGNRAKGKVHELKDLDDQFDSLFSAAFDRVQHEQLTRIDEIKQNGLDYLDRRSDVAADVIEEQRSKFTKALDRLRNDADEAKAIDDVNVTTSKARAQYDIMVRTIENIPAPKPVVSGDKHDDPSNQQEQHEDHKKDKTTSGAAQPSTSGFTKKRVESVDARSIAGQSLWQIKNDTDIEKYLDRLRQNLKQKLTDADEVDINF